MVGYANLFPSNIGAASNNNMSGISALQIQIQWICTNIWKFNVSIWSRSDHNWDKALMMMMMLLPVFVGIIAACMKRTKTSQITHIIFRYEVTDMFQIGRWSYYILPGDINLINFPPNISSQIHVQKHFSLPTPLLHVVQFKRGRLPTEYGVSVSTQAMEMPGTCLSFSMSRGKEEYKDKSIYKSHKITFTISSLINSSS